MNIVTELGPEDVQSYPRPPALDRVTLPIRVVLGGETVAATDQALRVCETHHAPTYYLPPTAFRHGALSPATGTSHCEWKGAARYWTVSGGGVTRPRAAWSYPDPADAFRALKDHIAVYPGQIDACFLGDIQVTPQPGGFYGGWVTPNLTGSVKGAPGTEWW